MTISIAFGYAVANDATGACDTMNEQASYLTPKDIAAVLKVSVRTVQRNITTKEGNQSLLKAIRVGRRGLYRVTEEEFARWLDYIRQVQR